MPVAKVKEKSRPVGRKLTSKTELGQRFAAFVLARHDSFQKAADASGVSYQVLIDIASGRRVPLVTTLEEIVGKLGGTMAEFYGDSRAKPRRKEK